jgi:hypothetical protein
MSELEPDSDARAALDVHHIAVREGRGDSEQVCGSERDVVVREVNLRASRW